MPFPRQRSRSARRHQRKTPSGKVVTHYLRTKGSKHTCAICSAILQAVAVKSKKLPRLTKTQRRPERKLAGVLCGNCVERIIKEKTRLEMGSISREDVPLSHLKYIDKLSNR